MLVTIRNPKVWRFVIDNKTGTFTASSKKEAVITLQSLIGEYNVGDVDLFLIQTESDMFEDVQEAS